MKRVVLFCLALWIVLVVLGSASLHAQEANRPSAGIATVFDPFELRTILLAESPDAEQPVSSLDGVGGQTRHSIRVPFRLPVRSPYKPV